MPQPRTITLKLPRASTVAVIILAVTAIPAGFAAKAFMEYKQARAACVRDYYKRHFDEYKVQPNEHTKIFAGLICG